MKIAYWFLGAVGLVHLATIFAYPWRGVAFIQFMVLVVLGAVVLGGAVLIAKKLRDRHAAKDAHGLDPESDGRPEPSVARASAVCVVLVVAQLVFVRLVAPHLGSFWAVEGGYYGILAAAGVALALWARARPHVGAVVATVAILAISAVTMVRFFGDPGIDFQYGPEKWIFALQDHLARMNMWPLDAAVTASACLIAGSFRDS